MFIQVKSLEYWLVHRKIYVMLAIMVTGGSSVPEPSCGSLTTTESEIAGPTNQQDQVGPGLTSHACNDPRRHQEATALPSLPQGTFFSVSGSQMWSPTRLHQHRLGT